MRTIVIWFGTAIPLTGLFIWLSAYVIWPHSTDFEGSLEGGFSALLAIVIGWSIAMVADL